MWKKFLTIPVALVMVLSLAACVQLPPAQEIVNNVIEAWDDIRTCEFEMDMTMDMVAEAEGEAVEMTIVMDFTGVSDFENGQMRMDMTISMAMFGEDEIEMGTEAYLIGDMMYMLMEIPGMEPMWAKSEMPEGTWGGMIQVEAQIELLEAAQVEVIGSERISGVDCYVLEVTPDMGQLWQLVMQQAELTGEMPPFTEEMFRNFSVKQ